MRWESFFKLLSRRFHKKDEKTLTLHNRSLYNRLLMDRNVWLFPFNIHLFT